MNDCPHRRIRIEGSWGANAAAHLICTDCGQTHGLSTEEENKFDRIADEIQKAKYLASLLKREDLIEADPDVVHE